MLRNSEMDSLQISGAGGTDLSCWKGIACVAAIQSLLILFFLFMSQRVVPLNNGADCGLMLFWRLVNMR